MSTITSLILSPSMTKASVLEQYIFDFLLVNSTNQFIPQSLLIIFESVIISEHDFFGHSFYTALLLTTAICQRLYFYSLDIFNACCIKDGLSPTSCANAILIIFTYQFKGENHKQSAIVGDMDL